MTDGVVQLQPNSTGAKIDTSELTVGANLVERQRINIADPASAAAIAAVSAANGLQVDVTRVQGVIVATQSGTWTVQPGNTVNTTPWLTAINSGGNTASVKAASTAISASDLPLAVGLHPSSPLPAGANVIGAVNAPALVKGTQGANGFSTQDIKDAGRTAISLYAANVTSGATGVETAITLTKSSGTAATASAATFVVTSGKRFRIQSIVVGVRGNATATAQVTTFALRVNPAGAVTTTSTPIVIQARCYTPATASAQDRQIIPIPDGYEIAGDGTLQFGVTANSVFVTNAPTWDVSIVGFEY